MKRDDNAISEALGALLLLGLTVIGITIVLVVALSQIQVTTFPTTELTAVDLDYGTHHTLEILHAGGDPLYCGDLEILVNGTDVTYQGILDKVLFKNSNQSLTIGKNLSYYNLNSVDNLSILYNGSGTGSALMYYTEKFVVVKV